MILAELKDYLSSKHIASKSELLEHFSLDEETLAEMLNVWIEKGNVRKVESAPSGCGKCAHCYHFPEDEEYYEWL